MRDKMTKAWCRGTWSSICFLLLFSVSTWAQSGQEDLTEWLNRKIKEISSARINQRSNTNQTESPAMSSNSTSLVDQSSVSDLVGVALNLAELSGVSVTDQKATSASVTVTAYSVYAGFKGIDPLDPAVYSQHKNWRRVSLTLGYDSEKDAVSGDTKDRATMSGIKYMFWNRRDASHPCFWNPKLSCYNNSMEVVSKNLEAATGGFSRLFDEIDEYLYGKMANKLSLPELSKAQKQDRDKFRNEQLADGPKFQALLALLGPDEVKKLEELIATKLKPFEELQESSIHAIESVRRAPQLSLSVFSKRRKTGPNEYMAELIFDYGLHPRINWTANGTFEYKDNKTGPDNRGGKLSTQFSIQVTPERRLEGRKPITFNLSAESTWMTSMTPTYKGQAKFSIPILDGINFPVSFTYASKTDLVNEKEVRGQFGFTFDVSRLLAAVK